MVADPIQELAHDHRELSGLLLAIHDALTRIDRKKSVLDDELNEIKDGIESFREALLLHFAREQEALLPFLASHVPALRERADAIIVVEHDRIGHSLTSLAGDASNLDTTTIAAWRKKLGEFENLYAAHTKSELAFLTDVSLALANDPAATQKLRTLLAE